MPNATVANLQSFLKLLEQLCPPPANCHHVVMYSQFGGLCGYTDKLLLQVNKDGIFYPFFFEDEDFEKGPAILVDAILALMKTVSPKRLQISRVAGTVGPYPGRKVVDPRGTTEAEKDAIRAEALVLSSEDVAKRHCLTRSRIHQILKSEPNEEKRAIEISFGLGTYEDDRPLIPSRREIKLPSAEDLSRRGRKGAAARLRGLKPQE